LFRIIINAEIHKKSFFGLDSTVKANRRTGNENRSVINVTIVRAGCFWPLGKRITKKAAGTMVRPGGVLPSDYDYRHFKQD
jgi:hypothetical protein